jgi:hypothetical protein
MPFNAPGAELDPADDDIVTSLTTPAAGPTPVPMPPHAFS